MSREVRLIHTADSHIGYRQYHSEVRRQDFLDAFSVVINDAVEMGVDAVVHAGDLFDSRNPTLDDILDTMNILSRLKNAGIPFLSIVGNHESKQNTQWLDLFQKMGIATRLGSTPHRIRDVAVYGIDSVPKSKIPVFDYSIFDDECIDSDLKLLVMHQLMKPFPFGEWDCEEVLDSLPFDVNAILLGDYHKYEKIKVRDAWVTYCGSSERNSASEKEERSYNIITINDSGIDISRRRIPTREFVFIPVALQEGPGEIFNSIKEHEIKERVVFVDITGNPDISVSYSEVEDFLLSGGALVPRVRDMRTGDADSGDDLLEISFSDPDEAVKQEIKKMNLTAGGILIDEIVRDPVVGKSKVDLETENRIAGILEDMDFTQPIQHIRGAVVQEIEGLEVETTGPKKLEETVYEKIAPIEEKPVEGTVADKTEETSGSDLGESGDADSGIFREGSEKKAGDTLEMDENRNSDTSSGKPKRKISAPKQYNLGDYL